MMTTKTRLVTLGAPILNCPDDVSDITEPQFSPITGRVMAFEAVLRALVLSGIVVIDIFLSTPFERKVIGLQWAYYAFPYEQSETISFAVLFGLGLLVPISVVVTILGLQRGHNAAKRRLNLLYFTLALTLSICMNECITSLLKRSFGQLRPDFLSRCFNTPDVPKYLTSLDIELGNLPPVPTCVAPSSHLMEEARLSFPSGHSAYAAASFGILALWLHRNIPTRPIPSLRLVSSVLVAAFPLFVATTRTADYRHHPSDVIAGLLLGFSLAFLSDRIYQPQEHSTRSSVVSLIKPATLWDPEDESTGLFNDGTPTTRGPLDV